MMLKLLFWFVVLCVAWAYWPIALGLSILFLVVRGFYRRRLELEKRVGLLTQNMPKYLDYVENGKTERTRLNNAEQCISNLEQVVGLDPHGKVATNAHELLEKMRACTRTIPVETALAKAEKAAFKGQSKSVLNAYLDALFSIEKLGTADTDFALVECIYKDTGEDITVDSLKERARALGWEN